MGPVFRCQDPETNRAVAVKAFALDITPEQATELAAALADLATLNLAHPSIIAPLAAGTEGSTAFLVQEYFVAESIDVALRQYGPAPIPDALRLVGQLAGAIDFAAVTEVRHGSLHPRDILVAPHEVRLTGLGVAQAVERVGFRVAPRLPYSAPERIEGHAWNGAADVFALAAVAFELLTGRRPSIGPTPLGADASVSGAADQAALAEAFARAFSPRAEDRFPTALSFAASLRHALTGEPLELAPVHPHLSKRRERGAGRPARLPLEPKPEADARQREHRQPPPVVPVPLLEPVEPPEEVPVSAAEQLLAAPERLDEDLALQSPGAPADELEAQETPLVTDRLAAPDGGIADVGAALERDRFAGLEPFAGRETEEPPEPERFTSLEPPAEIDDGGAGHRFEEIEPPPEADRLEEPQFVEVTPDERLALDLFSRDEPVAEPGGSLALEATPFEPPPEQARVEPPPVEPMSVEPPRVAPPLSLEPPPDVEPGYRPPDRADQITLSAREEVSMPSPPSGSPAPGRPFTPPPSGRGTASFGRPRLPFSWLLAMLLLGVLGGFVGGYFLGSGDRRGAGQAEDTALPATKAQPRAENPGVPAQQRESQPSATAPRPAVGQVTPAPPAGAAAGAKPPSGTAGTPAAAGERPRNPEARKPVPKPSPPPATARRPAAPAPSRAARPSVVARTDEAADSSGRFEGSLAVISRPPGATVRLDGRVVGKTPVTLSAVGAGSHAVRIELDGYRPWSAAIQVVAGTQNRVTASLEQRPGGIDE